MLSLERELAALKFIDALSAHLKDVREPHKALRHALRDTRDFFRASHGCIATLRPGRPQAELLFKLPKAGEWNRDVLTRYIRHTHPPVQRDMLNAVDCLLIFGRQLLRRRNRRGQQRRNQDDE